MNCPTRKGYSHRMKAATGIVRHRGIGRIIREMAVNEADKHRNQSDHDRRCHQTPHVSSKCSEAVDSSLSRLGGSAFVGTFIWMLFGKAGL